MNWQTLIITICFVYCFIPLIQMGAYLVACKPAEVSTENAKCGWMIKGGFGLIACIACIIGTYMAFKG